MRKNFFFYYYFFFKFSIKFLKFFFHQLHPTKIPLKGDYHQPFSQFALIKVNNQTSKYKKMPEAKKVAKFFFILW